MSDENANRWQFSLRSALVITTLSAIALTASRFLGVETSLQVLFVVASIGVPWILSPAVRRMYGAAYAAVYGPFFAMASFSLLTVDCSHCVQAAWTTIPFGPTLIPILLLRSAFGPALPVELYGFLASTFFSGGLVVCITWLLKKIGFTWRVILLLVTVVSTSFSAYGLLCLIRA